MHVPSEIEAKWSPTDDIDMLRDIQDLVEMPESSGDDLPKVPWYYSFGFLVHALSSKIPSAPK